MPRAWLSLGSNIDRRRNILGAVKALERQFGDLVISRVYESEAVGFDSAPFFNLVVGIDTGLPPPRIQEILRAIESDHGRERRSGELTARTLDIDLLTYGDQVIDTGQLRLPRDEILRYAFVLRPLAEVAPKERHPEHGKSYAELWAAFDSGTQPLKPVALSFGAGRRVAQGR